MAENNLFANAAGIPACTHRGHTATRKPGLITISRVHHGDGPLGEALPHRCTHPQEHRLCRCRKLGWNT